MSNKKLHSLFDTTRKLRVYSILFVFALILPLAVLVRQTLLQLEWESFHQTRIQAEALVTRIAEKLDELNQEEESRSISDYQFLTVTGSNNFVLRSSLSQLPLASDIPGLVGYFQINAASQLTTPTTPSNELQAREYGLTEDEYRERIAMRQKLIDILSQNALVTRQLPEPQKIEFENTQMAEPGASGETVLEEKAYEPQAASVVSQSAFDKLDLKPAKTKRNTSIGRLEDLELDDELRSRSAKELRARPAIVNKQKAVPNTEKRAPRKEKSVIADVVSSYSQAYDNAMIPEKGQVQKSLNREVQVKIFDSEIEPFKANILDSGHIVVYRSAWTDSQRLIQGFLINQDIFFKTFIEEEFFKGGLFSSTRLVVAHNGDLIAAYGATDSKRYRFDSSSDLSGNLLLKQTLPLPFSNLELLFTIQDLPVGAGGKIVMLSASLLFAAIIIGVSLFYRYALAQLSLMNQQQDFVSSVSHELKTPLTSIRMYGEILREGWADDAKKKEYYDYIFYESERLTRLINNVLQLAKLTRNSISADMKPFKVSQLSDVIRSKLSSQAERAGFELNLQLVDFVSEKIVEIDEDMFTQVAINLVDNAIKYSAKATHKVIDVTFSETSSKKLRINIRDYGPGIDRKQLKKIFTLFYRNENELTRETKGTGIGLALVRQYVGLMEGTVDAVNKEPGVEIVLTF